MVLTLDYDALSKVAKSANKLAEKAEDYADDLSKKVIKKFAGVSGGMNDLTQDAQYYVNAKISALKAKQTAYKNLATTITNYISDAKRIDKEVANMIKNDKEAFLKGNEHLRIDDWKANILNWLVNLKNACPLFEVIGNAIRSIGTALSDMMANIKYWYKCEGGKEIVSFVLAIGGAIVAVLLFIASFPASGFVAICAAIGAAITAVNAITNVITSYKSLRAAKDGDPAWAKIYGKQDKLTDVIRAHNFKNGTLNKVMNGVATLIDGVELFCDVVNIIDGIKKIKSKLSFLQNYFDKNNGGLLTYFKEAKYTEVLDYDIYGKPCGTKWTLKVNEHGIVETRFTPKSVWRGIKSFVMDKPIASNSETGIKTLLKQNFKTDFKDWRKSFSIQGIKDTFKYNATDGGRITFDQWKDSMKLSNLKDTFKYNIKYGSVKGMFTSGIKWEHRKDMISTTANTIKSVTGIASKIESVFNGSYDFKKDVSEKVFNFSEVLKPVHELGISKLISEKIDLKFDEDSIPKMIGEKLGWKYAKDGVIQNGVNIWKNTYTYKLSHANE